MSTLLLKKMRHGFSHFSRDLHPVQNAFGYNDRVNLFFKIVIALTNRRAIDKNYKIVWKGDEREEL